MIHLIVMKMNQKKNKKNENSIDKGCDIEDSNSNIHEWDNIDIKAEINKTKNIFESFSDNKNFIFNLEKFYNDINLSKINQKFVKDFEDNYNKYKDNINSIFLDDNNSDEGSISYCNNNPKKNKIKNKGKNKNKK